MLSNNNVLASGVKFMGGGAPSSLVDSRSRVGWSIANRCAFSKQTSYPVGYYENALKRPVSEGGIGSTFRAIGIATASADVFGIGSVAATLSLDGSVTTTGFLIAGLRRSGTALGSANVNNVILRGRGIISASLNIGFKPSAFDIAQEVWGAFASRNNVVGTMGEKLNAATGGGGASAASIATAVWDRALSGHLTVGSAGRALADAGGGSSPSTIASAVRTELSTELGRIDVSTSSRLAAVTYTIPPTASIIASQVRTELTAELGRVDVTLSTRLSAAGYTVPDNATIGTLNTKLGTPAVSVSADIATRASQSSVNGIPTTTLLTGDSRLNNLDATISSRLATSSYTIPPTTSAIRTELTTELSRIDVAISSRNSVVPPTVSQIRTELDTNSTKLDVTVGSRLSAASYSAPPSASSVASQVRTELGTELARLDVAGSTRLASASYTAPDNATVGVINTKLGTPATSISADISTRSSQSSVDGKPTLAQIEASSVIAKVSDITATQLTIVGEINANETKIDTLQTAINTKPNLAAIEGSAVLAKEATLAPKASQSSVNAIPTNSLLTNDSRLSNLDATISSRLAASSYTAPLSSSAISSAVWSHVTRSLNVDVTLSSAQANAIAVAVEAAIINEGDGNQVVNAIVAAIGNVNVSASIIASAVRTELSTELARLDVTASSRLATSSYVAPNNANIVAILADTDELQKNQNQWLTATGFATSSNVTAARDVIITEVNANEVKIDAIKTKTDTLVNTDLSLVEADLVVINEGVKNASLLIPHSTNLP